MISMCPANAGHSNPDKTMIKNILQLYALLVCLITVVILIVSFSMSLNLVTSLVIPEYKYYSSLRSYDSNEAYIEDYEHSIGFTSSSLHELPSSSLDDSERQYWKDKMQKVIALQQLPPNQLDEKRLAARRQYLENKKVQDITSLIYTLQWVLIAMIFFFIHWKIYKKSEK